MTMQDEAVVVLGATLMIWNSGRSTPPDTSLVPETRPSAWRIATIIAPKKFGLDMASRASFSWIPLPRRNSSKRLAKLSRSGLSAGLMMRMPSTETFRAAAASFTSARSPSRMGTPKRSE